jgi:hypothetical protein
MEWDSEYPTHVEVPENYWTYSHSVEFNVQENENK